MPCLAPCICCCCVYLYRYGLDKSTFNFYKTVYDLIQSIIFLKYGIFPLLWGLGSQVMVDYLGYVRDESFWQEVVQSIVFSWIYTVVTTLIGLPFELYFTFVVEEAHGFKTKSMTYGLFFKDKLTSLALSFGLSAPVLMAFLYTIAWGGEYFYVYATILMLVLNLLGVLIYPTFIQPCFNKVEPLEGGELRSAIEDLAKSVDFPLSQLYKVDGSKRSAHSNAYFYGFCNQKRIVLFDTLIDQATKEEVVVTLIALIILITFYL